MNPDDMVILKAGMIKSGNVWLWTLLRSIARHAGMKEKGYVLSPEAEQWARNVARDLTGMERADGIQIGRHSCHIKFGPYVGNRIRDIDAYVSQCRHVWTHSPIHPTNIDTYRRFHRIVYIIRDPRDIAISFARWAFTPSVLKVFPHYRYDRDPAQFLASHLDYILRTWVSHVGSYLQWHQKLRIHIVFYERLLHAFDEELGRLLSYLGINLAETGVTAVKEDVAFEAMKRHNPMHLRAGMSRQWVESFGEEQQRLSELIAGRMLRLLHYPVSIDEPERLPVIPAGFSGEDLEEAIAQARRGFRDHVGRIYGFLTGSRPVMARLHSLGRWTKEQLAGTE